MAAQSYVFFGAWLCSHALFYINQLQRKVETALREQRDILRTAKTSGLKDVEREAKEKISILTGKYNKLSKASGLPTKMERTKSALKVDKNNKRDIINYKISDRMINIHNETDFNLFEFEEIEDAMNSSDVGKKYSRYILKNGYNITINYDVDADPNICGSIIKKDVNVYACNHDNVEEVACTIIHEVSHERYNWKYTQEDEINCYLMEFMHIEETLTENNIRDIVNFVKENYSHLPKGELYGY